MVINVEMVTAQLPHLPAFSFNYLHELVGLYLKYTFFACGQNYVS